MNVVFGKKKAEIKPMVNFRENADFPTQHSLSEIRGENAKSQVSTILVVAILSSIPNFLFGFHVLETPKVI